jgi:hypothetical protein
VACADRGSIATRALLAMRARVRRMGFSNV